MKKLSLALVALLFSMISYGATGNWEDDSDLPETWMTSGYVGIGEASPETKLHIKGNHVSQIGLMKLEGTGHAVLTLDPASGYDAAINFQEADEIKWRVGYVHSDERFRFRNLDYGEDILTISNNGNVGIGTTSPGEKLEVNGNLKISNNSYLLGNVGIGTTSPDYKLHVADGQTYTKYYSNDGTYALMVENTGGDGCGLDVKAGYGTGKDGTIARFRNEQGDSVTIEENGSTIINMYSDTNYALNVRNTSGNGLGLDVYAGYGYDTTGIVARFRTDQYTCMIVKENGNVGIGTDDPGGYKLAVDGHIRTKEITVETGWSDFVFADNYQLMPLSRLEEHIKTNKSLPGIPKEKEVAENGVNLGEMQAKLLEKVEELTLYMIELKRENEELRKRIDALEN